MVTRKIKKKTPKRKVTKRISKKSKKKTTTKRKVTKRKSPKKKTPKSEELLYMGISNPVEIRKTVLESARDMVQFLQLFEKFRIIREEKNEATIILKKEIKQLNTLVNKLKKALPKTSIRARKEVKEQFEEVDEMHEEEKEDVVEHLKTRKVTKATKPQDMPDIQIDDIEALETELKEIEDKLNFL